MGQSIEESLSPETRALRSEVFNLQWENATRKYSWESIRSRAKPLWDKVCYRIYEVYDALNENKPHSYCMDEERDTLSSLTILLRWYVGCSQRYPDRKEPLE